MRRLKKRGGQPWGCGLGAGRGRGRGRAGPEIRFRPSSPCRLDLSVTRETLTYAQAQKMVEVELEGRLHRINISDPLSVITEDEVMAEDLAECNSNKENSEQSLGRAKQGRKAAAAKGRKKEGKQAQGRRHGDPKNVKKQTDPSTYSQLAGSLPEPTFRVLDSYTPSEAAALPVAYYRYMEKSGEELDMEAEYDMDEQDMAWLDMVNQKRVSDGHASVSPDTFELLIDRLEQESILESRSQALSQNTIDEDAFCCICLDDECLNSNVILFCDICNLAVHQECYGVPYIPEGQWLCRRCLQSPSRPVDCVLCPNRGGAFKQTSDGSWAHVICAIWIPEVCFANTVFLEPVEGVKNIPPARWKLTCYLCKQKGRGASIQCHKANCYRAFHVTCAQRAGLFMKIEPVREAAANGTTFAVKKTAFCENHSPPAGRGQKGARAEGEEEEDEEEEEENDPATRCSRGQRVYTRGPSTPQNQRGNKKGQKQQQKGRRSSEVTGRRSVPLLLVPQIPSYRLNKICTGVAVQRKNQFMQRLHNYWLLKRHSRNGVPLIRRLHSHLQNQRTAEQREPDARLLAMREKLKYWQKLRQDLEKARLLVELIRKRERLKREQMKIDQAVLELQLTPATVLLRSTLEQLQEKDSAGIFTMPVNLKEVPDYLEFVSQPMDFFTMRKKLESQAYRTVSDLESDFNLMVSNCLRYNDSDTVFHHAALQLQEVGGAILRHAQRQAFTTGLDPNTGMHLPAKPNKRNPYQSFWEEENRLHLSPEEQLKSLLEKLDFITSMRTSGGRTKRVRLLRREINSIRHKLSLQQRASSPLRNGNLRAGEKSAEHRGTMPIVSPTREQGNPNSKSPASQEPSCPASSPLPGDAPPNPPIFGPENSGTRTPGLCKLQKSRGRKRSDCQEQSLFDPDTKDGGIPCLTGDAVNGLSSPVTPPASPVLGVGRRTSVLFQKAKNGTRLKKTKPANRLHNGDTAEDSSNGGPISPSEPSEATLLSVQTSPPPRHLRSRGPSASSESELEKPESPPKDSVLTNGFKKHRDGTPEVQGAARSQEPHSGIPPPKRSRGKPALSKAAAQEGRSADSTSGRSILGPSQSEEEEQLAPLNLVWAKCRGYPSYPAMMVDPNMPREGLFHNGIPIPVPPRDVLQLGKRRQAEAEEKLYLVLFFDAKRTWQWLPRDKLHHLGMDETADKLRLVEGKKPSVRKSVHTAYDRAIMHLSHVRGNASFAPSNFI
ncbi:bromodomain and PHD finger-containing protein 3 isoform X2 [Denticeps clupeoides]|uniref:bromodomain and PHD finger-containing protein 3 isoform X2 n=1 Tax=Denticeps clupeoides TaxID=299321 RepID=UPI0010A335E5|nr:bromodomain and PHD finger-containing protein 3-like isoform X2 [Denticeps clupeoides]